MTYLRLFWEFFKTGLFAVGGGMATVPFLKNIGLATGWYSQTDLMNMLAVSESTPGPIGINMATYVGFTVAGIPGAVIATIGEVTPSIIVILIVAAMLTKFRNSKYVENAFYGLRPASSGLIGAACAGVVLQVLLRVTSTAVPDSLFMRFSWDGTVSWMGLALAAVALALVPLLFQPIVFPLFKLYDQTAQIATALAVTGFVSIPLHAYSITAVTGVLRAGGDVFCSAALDISPQWLVALPLTAVMALALNASCWWVAAAVQAESLLKCPLCWYRIRRGRWIHDVTLPEGRDL